MHMSHKDYTATERLYIYFCLSETGLYYIAPLALKTQRPACLCLQDERICPDSLLIMPSLCDWTFAESTAILGGQSPAETEGSL